MIPGGTNRGSPKAGKRKTQDAVKARIDAAARKKAQLPRATA